MDAMMKTIYLQAIGEVPAIPASEAKPGMMMVYNYGLSARIVAVEDVSPKFIAITTSEGGKTYAKRYGKNRLISVSSRIARPS